MNGGKEIDGDEEEGQVQLTALFSLGKGAQSRALFPTPE